MARKVLPIALIWLLLNLILGAISELHPDEAYYWMYSHFLAWGYFDHPPMIALMTYVGYFLLPSEIGVRLMVMLLVSATIFIIPFYKKDYWPDNKWQYALIIFSIVSLSVIGLTNTPDGYLLFFTSIYLLIYKEITEGRESFPLALLWGFVMACMLYSKYHGILVILLTMASNPALLRKKNFWIAGIFGALLFTPHLWWQFQNDFPSVQYHLIGRNQSTYQFKYSLEYLLGEAFYFGPLVGFLLYYYTFKSTAEDLLERCLKFIVYGFLIFFLLMTLRGRVEANWTVVIVIPLIYFALKYLKQNPTQVKWFNYLAIPSIILLLIARVQIVYPVIPLEGDRTSEMRGNEKFTEEVLSSAKNLPVVANTYQVASILSFYSDRLVTSLNVSSRKNQFDFWTLDAGLYDRPIYFLNRHLNTGDDFKNERGETFKGTVIEEPVFLRGVFLEAESFSQDPVTGMVQIKVKINLHNQYTSIHGQGYSLVELVLLNSDNVYETALSREISLEQIKDGEIIEISGSLERIDAESRPAVQLSTPGIGVWTRTNLEIQ